MNKETLYRVYDKKGAYHHSYSKESDAINCAKHILGSVKIVDGKQEEEIFKLFKYKN